MPARRLPHLGLAALLLALSGGCFRLESLDERVAEAWCDYHVTCGEYPDRDTCMEASFRDGGDAYLQAAVDADRVVYHRARARRCVRAIKGLECLKNESIDAAIGDACDGIFEGQVAPEEPCMINEECMGGLSRCGFDPTCADACCPGACRYIDGPMDIGEPCNATITCVRGATCDQGTCVALPGPGEPCDGSLCAAGSGCSYDTFTCVERGPVGAACVFDEECVTSAYCALNNTCTAMVDTDEPCDDDRACIRVSDTCKDGRCRSPADPGQPCAYDWECVGWAFCHDATCTAYRGLGESCVDGFQSPQRCYGGLYCTAGACAVLESGQVDVCPIPE